MRHSPFSILRRHFFRRLFQNDLINLEDQMKEKVIAGLAVLSVLCGFFAYAHISKYLLLPGMEGSWRETTVYLHFLMVIMGFATVLEWEVLIPDSRDAANLIPLPLRVRTLFAAKFASLLLFAGGLALGMNALGVLVFTFYLPASHSNSLVFSLRYACSITVAGLAACLAVFFSVIFLIGLMMWLCGPRLYNRVSHLLRTLILMGFVVQMVLFFTGAVPFMGSLLDLGAGALRQRCRRDFPRSGSRGWCKSFWAIPIPASVRFPRGP